MKTLYKNGLIFTGSLPLSQAFLVEGDTILRVGGAKLVRELADDPEIAHVDLQGQFVCSGFQESMIDPMIYGIILNQDSFDNLMELREMVETGIMRLASQKYDEEDGHALEAMLEQMKEIVHSGDNEVDRFFAVDNEFHDLISQMGKNPLADKISRVVRTLTHAVRYETVSTMITSGRGDELVAAHSKLLEILRGHEGEDVEEIVRGTYFGDIIHGEEK